MRFAFILTIVLSTLFIIPNSCNYDNLDTVVIDPIDSSFVIGIEKNNIKVVVLNRFIKTIIPQRRDVYYEFDMDNDNTIDIVYKLSANASSHGGQYTYSSSINIINPLFQASLTKMVDTTFQCINNSNDKYTVYNNYYDFTCPEDNNNKILSVEYFSFPIVYTVGDTLINTEIWSNTEEVTMYYYSSYQSWEGNSFLKERGLWENQKNKYLLIKKDDDKKILYGWIKISDRNSEAATIHEYAMQIE